MAFYVSLPDVVLLFCNADFPILYMALPFLNDVSKFDDSSLHDLFVSVFDVVITLLDDVKPSDHFWRKKSSISKPISKCHL